MDKNYSKYMGFMKALADETRLEIVDMLKGGELCACNILERFNITQPTLSYHMKILSDAGIVEGRKEGIWMKYSINKVNMNLVKELIDGFNRD